MTAKPFARPRTLLVAIVASLLAMAAFAGPAAAHHHGRHHHHHHHHHHSRAFHHHLGDEGGGAGTIASFDPTTGKLVINLADGETASGLVTEFTRIDCGCGHDWDGRRQLHDFGSDDDHGWSHDGSDCDSSDLVTGAIVKEAVLGLKDGRAFFFGIELER